tara:strand:+ start:1120 stop:1410 length:291 start_codon:yes stop_codon:yes gene_type:complete
MPNKKMGIYTKKDKTFYYLETGTNHIGNEIDRIKKTLFQRSLIEVNFETGNTLDQYKILTLEEAKEEEYKFKPIFLNKFVQANFEANLSEDTSKWS